MNICLQGIKSVFEGFEYYVHNPKFMDKDECTKKQFLQIEQKNQNKKRFCTKGYAF